MQDNENLVSHLEALRHTLIKCFSALGIVILPCFFIAPFFLEKFIKILIGTNKITLNYFSPTEVFLIQLKVALLLDFIICFPYIVKKLWDFILPALYENEKKFIKSIVLTSSFLFISGVLFCAFVILPFIINFGISFQSQNIQPVFGISNVVSLSLWLCLIFGIMFQVPLIVHSLIKWEIISYKSIADKRPYVVVGLLIISAFLTPPDIISQIMLFGPVYLLFELGLLFSKK